MRIQAGWAKGTELAVPKGELTRPTAAKVRAAAINMLAPYMADGPFLDLCAGSGAMGLEAVSRGATGAAFIELSRAALACLRSNAAEVSRRAQAQAMPQPEFLVIAGELPQVLSRLKRSPLTPFATVFIDPPYEQPDEFEQVARALRASHSRWRNGLYLVWYPIKTRRPVEKLHEVVRALGAEALAVELLMLPEDVPQRLNGSGVILINPPWKLEGTLRALLPPLATFLAGPDGQPQARFVNLSAGRNPKVS